jgi:hypothetical protein
MNYLHQRQLLDYFLYSANADLAHLLLRATKPSPHANAKEPNAIAPFY